MISVYKLWKQTQSNYILGNFKPAKKNKKTNNEKA